MRARSPEAKDERRQRFINAALDEFFERGYSAARMDDIARRAGFAKGTLYLYFEHKEALFNALIETIALPNIQHIEAILQTTPNATTALQSLVEHAPLLLEQTPIPRIAKILIADGRNFPAIAQQYRQQVIDRLLAAICQLLIRADESGELRVEKPMLTARLVIAPIILSAIWQVVFASDPEAEVDVHELLALHAQLLLQAMKNPPELSV